MGGPCVFPELPAELSKLSSKGVAWPVSDHAKDRNRRSLYVFIRRNLRYPFFEAFDRPDTNASCPRRAVTTIAPQALTLLNSELASDAAARPGRPRATRGGAGPRRPGRPGLPPRLRAAARSRRNGAWRSRSSATSASLVQFCRALLNTNEFIYVD